MTDSFLTVCPHRVPYDQAFSIGTSFLFRWQELAKSVPDGEATSNARKKRVRPNKVPAAVTKTVAANGLLELASD